MGRSPRGERRGSHRKSTDSVAIFDAEGHSVIGQENFAIAVADEIEAGAHNRAHIHFAY